MELKKTPQADMEKRRTTGFLLGLVLVLSCCYVALEWNSIPSSNDFDALDLSELTHESELIPMSNMETVTQLREEQKHMQGEHLRVVDDNVEMEPADDVEMGEDGDGDDDTLLPDLQDDEKDKALAPLAVDPLNPLNFHVVEELPQYPGGAVEFMKWLTKNLRYPAVAHQRKVQGKVQAVFYVEKDGSISGLKVIKSLSPECDQEALRVLSMMPKWQPGIQHDQPCRTKVSIPIVFKL
jgi:protein TonB